VFNANACFQCHAVGTAQAGPPQPPLPPFPKDAPPRPGGPAPRGKGPNLAQVAAKPGRDADWFVAFVTDPKKTTPDSKMPPFEGRIKPEDLPPLAEFLADLK